MDNKTCPKPPTRIYTPGQLNALSENGLPHGSMTHLFLIIFPNVPTCLEPGSMDVGKNSLD